MEGQRCKMSDNIFEELGNGYRYTDRDFILTECTAAEKDDRLHVSIMEEHGFGIAYIKEEEEEKGILEEADPSDFNVGRLPVLEGSSAISYDSSQVLPSVENSSQSERELDESINDPTNSPPTHDEDSTGKQGFDCTKCKKRFSVESDLGSHVMMCCGNLSTQCPVCKKIFASKSYIGKHMRLHTGEKPFQCGECGMRFTRKHHLVHHQRTHTGEKPFKCTECGKGFIKKSDLKVHFRRHGGNEPFQCSYCNRKLNSKSDFMRHERTHTGEKPYPCSSCSKRFPRKHQLLRHERKVHLKAKSPETSKDSNDNSAVSFQKDLDKRKTCSDKSSYQCPECNKKFKTKLSFTQHMKEHTGDKIYQCSERKKGFTSESGLKGHMRIHTDEPVNSREEQPKVQIESGFEIYLIKEEEIEETSLQQNDVCCSSKNASDDLDCQEKISEAQLSEDGCLEVDNEGASEGEHLEKEDHEDSESGWLPVLEGISAVSQDSSQVLPRLENSSQSERELDESMNDPTNSPPTRDEDSTGKQGFDCTKCKKRFSVESDLGSHVMTCCGNLSTQCPVCKKIFASKSNLGKHMRLHTGEKPFECGECGMRFTLKQHLVYHQRTHTGEKPFKCTECGKGFIEKSVLKVHFRRHGGNEPFQCSYCDRKLNSKRDLMRHERTHTGEKPFKCSECGKGFSQKSNLTLHFRKHGGNEAFQCSYCSRKLNSKSDFMRHERTHTGEKPHPCSSCSKRFSRKHQLLVHERTHTGEKLFLCSECGKRFSRKQELLRHESKVHLKAKSPETSKDFNNDSAVSFQKDLDKRKACSDKSSYQCRECNKKFKTKMSFTKHMKEHTGDKIYQCGECKKGFTSESGLKGHMRIHTDIFCSSKNASDDLAYQEKISESQLSEDGCSEDDSEGASEGEHLEKKDHEDSESGWLPASEGISAVSQDSSQVLPRLENSSQSERELDESMNDPTNSPPTREEDSTGKQGFDCTKCKKRFPVESDLGSHVMTCCGNLSTQCPVCKKIFRSKSNLGKHMRLHTGEKPFECGECGMRFTRKHHLVHHQRTHTGEKPFKCTECGKGFIKKSDLKVHFRRHGGNEPFQCSYCNRKLNSKRDLIRHERTHTGEKPYPCSSCSKRFPRKQELLVHERIHSGENPFQCSECGKGFPRKQELLRHERKVHLKAKSPETSKDFNNDSAVSFQKDLDKQKTCSDKSSYQCRECNKKFKTKMSFTQHMKEHTGDKIYQCCERKKGFTSESGLKGHMRIHTDEPVNSREEQPKVQIESGFEIYLIKEEEIEETSLQQNDVCCSSKNASDDLDCQEKISEAQLSEDGCLEVDNEGASEGEHLKKEDHEDSESGWLPVLEGISAVSQDSSQVQPRLENSSQSERELDESMNDPTNSPPTCDEDSTGKQGFDCTKCKKRFSVESDLGSHVMTCQSARRFSRQSRI
eukprot:XP_011670980.1 PREDICTED: zinc finger protein Xfin [Strongylocentrotus purpuratus]